SDRRRHRQRCHEAQKEERFSGSQLDHHLRSFRRLSYRLPDPHRRRAGYGAATGAVPLAISTARAKISRRTSASRFGARGSYVRFVSSTTQAPVSESMRIEVPVHPVWPIELGTSQPLSPSDSSLFRR